MFSLKDKRSAGIAPIIISLSALIVSVGSVFISYNQMIIANKSYIDAKEQAQINSMAYLNLTSISIDNFEVGKSPSSVVSLKNSGMTPALNTRVWIDDVIAENNKPISIYKSDNPSNASKTMMPGSETFVRKVETFKITADQMSSHASGITTLKSYVTIAWDDVYGKPYSYRVCMKKAFLIEQIGGSTVFCE